MKNIYISDYSQRIYENDILLFQFFNYILKNHIINNI